MSRKMGIFGGAFDPPHVGHVLAAAYVLLTERLERVFVVPCAEHPFGKDQRPFAHRYEMCRLAFAMLGDRVEVSDIENEREGPSYTIDTVWQFAERYPNAELELIIGSDNLRNLDKWHRSEELRRMVTLRVLQRLEENTAEQEKRQKEPFYLPRVSGTALREMMREGRDVSRHLPAAVLEYIREHRLY